MNENAGRREMRAERSKIVCGRRLSAQPDRSHVREYQPMINVLEQ